MPQIPEPLSCSSDRSVNGAESLAEAGDPSLNWKQRALYQLMSDISEECYCAGWMWGNEFALWRMASEPDASRRYGQCEVTEEQVADLRAISADVGGWVRWHDDADDSMLPPEEWGPRFEPLEGWLRRYERHMAQQAASKATGV